MMNTVPGNPSQLSFHVRMMLFVAFTAAGSNFGARGALRTVTIHPSFVMDSRKRAISGARAVNMRESASSRQWPRTGPMGTRTPADA